MTTNANSLMPRVFERDGAVYASSQDVANYFGKKHYDVLDDIDRHIGHAGNLPHEEKRRFAGFFVLREVAHPTVPGRKVRTFDMTRDGFALVVMGYTGAKAMSFKLRYIDQFSRMEAALKAQSGRDVAAVLPGAVAAAVRAEMGKVVERLAALEAAVPGLHHDPGVERTRNFVTALAVAERKGLRKRTRNATVRIGNAIEAFCRAHPEYEAPRWSDDRHPVRLFHRDAVAAWLRRGGLALIRSERDRTGGQAVMMFEPPRKGRREKRAAA